MYIQCDTQISSYSMSCHTARTKAQHVVSQNIYSLKTEMHTVVSFYGRMVRTQTDRQKDHVLHLYKTLPDSLSAGKCKAYKQSMHPHMEVAATMVKIKWSSLAVNQRL